MISDFINIDNDHFIISKTCAKRTLKIKSYTKIDSTATNLTSYFLHGFNDLAKSATID